jgi:hypothetical protein
MADVSGSMQWAANGAPLRASVALSLLLMDVNPPPWEGVVLTFDSNPRVLRFGPRPTDNVPRDIGRLAHELKMAGSGTGTNLQAAMQLIIEIAQKHKVQPSEWQLIIFSDMEFDEAAELDDSGSEEDSLSVITESDQDELDHEEESDQDELDHEEESDQDELDHEEESDQDELDHEEESDQDELEEEESNDSKQEQTASTASSDELMQIWQTAYEETCQRFRDAKLGDGPNIVFWNLAASVSQPVDRAELPGVIQIAGYSAQLLSAFLKGDLKEFTTALHVQRTLQRPVYQSLHYVAEDDVHDVSVVCCEEK